MDIARLRTFVAVARHGSMTHAAESLALTQPAISRQIAALEREFGTPLVERLARGVRLTEQGRALLRHADAILLGADAAHRELKAIGSGAAGSLALAAFPSANARLMPRAMATFTEAHPGVELSLAEALSAEVIPRVRVGEIDVAVIAVDERVTGASLDGLVADHLLVDDFLVALSVEHPLASEDRLTLDQLRDEVWVEASSPEFFRPVLRACAQAGFEPRVPFRSDNWNARLSLVATGIAIAMLPRLGLTGGHDDLVLRALTGPAPTRQVYAICGQDGLARSAVRAMLAALRDVGEAIADDGSRAARR